MLANVFLFSISVYQRCFCLLLCVVIIGCSTSQVNDSRSSSTSSTSSTPQRLPSTQTDLTKPELDENNRLPLSSAIVAPSDINPLKSSDQGKDSQTDSETSDISPLSTLTPDISTPRANREEMTDPLGLGRVFTVPNASASINNNIRQDFDAKRMWIKTALPTATELIKLLRTLPWPLPTLRTVVAQIVSAQSLSPEASSPLLSAQEVQSERQHYLTQRLRTLLYFGQHALARELIAQIPSSEQPRDLIPIRADIALMNNDIPGLCAAVFSVENLSNIAFTTLWRSKDIAQGRALCLALRKQPEQAILEALLVEEIEDTPENPQDNLFPQLLHALITAMPREDGETSDTSTNVVGSNVVGSNALGNEDADKNSVSKILKNQRDNATQPVLSGIHLITARLAGIALSPAVLRAAVTSRASTPLLTIIAQDQTVPRDIAIVAQEILITRVTENSLAAVEEKLVQNYQKQILAQQFNTAQQFNQIQSVIIFQQITSNLTNNQRNSGYSGLVQAFINAQRNHEINTFLTVYDTVASQLNISNMNISDIKNTPQAIRALAWMLHAWHGRWNQARRWLPTTVQEMNAIQLSWRELTQAMEERQISSLSSTNHDVPSPIQVWLLRSQTPPSISQIYDWSIPLGGTSLGGEVSPEVSAVRTRRSVNVNFGITNWISTQKDYAPMPPRSLIAPRPPVGSSVLTGDLATPTTPRAPQSSLLTPLSMQHDYWLLLLQRALKQHQPAPAFLLAAMTLTQYTSVGGLSLADSASTLSLIWQGLSPWLTKAQQRQLALEYAIYLQP